ncbi:hypothetical protein BD311DRAFT_812606 [Dichomitus squalens]|uniref:Uncharacterized protein n=1 Tax=Dichomitus squalens TaxID=114155 RepID=A0A4Q9M4I6_9APHY|nr:hypothetical protein BD311DRAFT_812606 [Dichomitus squalens]
MAFWRLHEGWKMWVEKNPDQRLVPGTPSFREKIVNRVFTEKELQIGYHNFILTNGENIRFMEDMYRISHFCAAQNLSRAQIERAVGKVSRNNVSKSEFPGGGAGVRWLCRTLMADLFVVATTAHFPDIENINPEDGGLSAADVATWNYKTLLNGDSHFVVTPEIREAVGGTESFLRGHVERHAEQEYLKLEAVWKEVGNQSNEVWTDEAMELVDAAYQRHLVKTEATKVYGEWDNPVWQSSMEGYWKRIFKTLGGYWAQRSKTLVGQDDIVAVDQALRKLQWVFFIRSHRREWCVPLMSRSHLADIIEYFDVNSDAFRMLVRTIDPLAQLPLLRVDNQKHGHHLTDYLGYLVFYLCDSTRYRFCDKTEVEDMLFGWLMTNINLLVKVSRRYKLHLEKSHRDFYSLTYSVISNAIVKARQAEEDNIYLKVISDLFPDRDFTEADVARVKAICKIITDAQAAVGKLTAKLKQRDLEGQTMHQTGMHQTGMHQTGMHQTGMHQTGSNMPSFSAVQLKHYPELYMLYNHGSDWMHREGQEMGKGKSTFDITYAFTMHAAFICYVETIGRLLLNCPEYTDLRDSFFRSFLNDRILLSLNDHLPTKKSWSSKQMSEPEFLNWDEPILEDIKERVGQLRPRALPVEVIPDGSVKELMVRAARIDDIKKCLARVASDILKYPIAHGQARELSDTLRGKPRDTLPLAFKVDRHIRVLLQACRVPVVHSIRFIVPSHRLTIMASILQEMIKYALYSDFRLRHPTAPFVMPSDVDVQDLLPVLPPAGPLPEGCYASMDDFATADPDAAARFARRLAELRMLVRVPTGDAESSSSDALSWRLQGVPTKSGQVYPQDLSWSGDWATDDIDDLPKEPTFEHLKAALQVPDQSDSAHTAVMPPEAEGRRPIATAHANDEPPSLSSPHRSSPASTSSSDDMLPSTQDNDEGRKVCPPTQIPSEVNSVADLRAIFEHINWNSVNAAVIEAMDRVENLIPHVATLESKDRTFSRLRYFWHCLYHSGAFPAAIVPYLRGDDRTLLEHTIPESWDEFKAEVLEENFDWEAELEEAAKRYTMHNWRGLHYPEEDNNPDWQPVVEEIEQQSINNMMDVDRQDDAAAAALGDESSTQAHSIKLATGIQVAVLAEDAPSEEAQGDEAEEGWGGGSEGQQPGNENHSDLM